MGKVTYWNDCSKADRILGLSFCIAINFNNTQF